MRRIESLLLPLLLFAATFAALPSQAIAQDEADPSGRVARLSYMQGSISYQVSGDQDWVQADPNRPLTTGDNLWADKDSRGELHIGSTAIRLSSETGLSILTLDDRTVQLELPQGTIEVHLRNHTAGDAFEIDTPNIALTLVGSGEYLITTDPNGTLTAVVVREGQVQATGGGESYTLDAGQQYTFTGGDQLTYDAQPAPGFDEFEDWCQSRDQRENNSVSAQYVSRDVDGVYDLDEYGNWQSDPDYGMVWMPTGVAVGWAPYRQGHWCWVAPWGWTWVEAEPWGFAPFHYGRWIEVSDRWGWVPGPMVVRPVYAPALVGFVGGRGGLSLSVSFGGGGAGVAWFPLGPRDVYMPGYRCSPRYVRTVNVTNTRVVNVTQVTNVYNNYTRNVNVTNIHYAYENNARAVTAVSRETFVNARPVAVSAMRVTPQQIQQARVVETAPVAPTRASYVSSQARPARAIPAVPFSQRPVVARLTPAAPVSRTAYTNNSRTFNQPPAARVNGAQPPARTGNTTPVAPAGGERTPIYTNDSRPFNQPSAARPNNVPPPARTESTPPPARTNNAVPSGTSNNNAQPRRNDGFRPFQAPGRAGNTTESAPASNNNRSVERPQQAVQPPQSRVRFAPPVHANDKMYDVHPPLNQRQAQPPAREQPARQPESRPAPPPKAEPAKPAHTPHGQR